MATKMMLAFLTTAVLLMADVQSEPDPSICIPHGPGGGGPPLPVFPEQYILQVEANILGWNQSIQVVEYYDAVNNRGAAHNIYSGKVSQTVIDYSTREIISARPDGNCSVRNLTAGRFNIFGFKLQNGTAHIGSVSDIFKFGASYNETYIGSTHVRGIPANHWQSCWYQEEVNGTSLLDYYFSIPGYNNSFGDAQIPLRLVLNGTASNTRFVHGKLEPVPGMHSYTHVYEFFNVQFNPSFDDRVFEPPLGVVCPGRKSLKPLPKVPDHFFQQVEVVVPARKSVFYMTEAYNYKSKMASYQYSFRTNGSTVRTPYRTLDDFNTGLTYRINLNIGFCNITPISLSSPDAMSPDSVHVQIKSVASYLHFESQDWQYEGVTQLRGLQAESWISQKTDWRPWLSPKSSQVNSTWEYFFTTVKLEIHVSVITCIV